MHDVCLWRRTLCSQISWNAFLATRAINVRRKNERKLINKHCSSISRYVSVFIRITSIKPRAGRHFNSAVWQNPQGLQYELTLAQMAGDVPRQRRLSTLIATAEGRYDFASPAYLNTQFPEIRPVSFQTWFQENWALIPWSLSTISLLGKNGAESFLWVSQRTHGHEGFQPQKNIATMLCTRYRSLIGFKLAVIYSSELEWHDYLTKSLYRHLGRPSWLAYLFLFCSFDGFSMFSLLSSCSLEPINSPLHYLQIDILISSIIRRVLN